MNAHGMRLSHARGRRMDGRGDGTAAAASCFAAMRSRIHFVFLESTDIARVRMALASAKQRSQHQRCFGTLPSSKNLRILTHGAPTAITCTGTHHEEPELEDHWQRGWGGPHPVGCRTTRVPALAVLVFDIIIDVACVAHVLQAPVCSAVSRVFDV